MTLYLHETHRVIGQFQDEFEAAFAGNGGWMQRLAVNDDARLLWYFTHAHGSGPSYHVVTITGIADGAAWERLARRVDSGDLRSWAADVDRLRYDVEGKLLLAVHWSPLQHIDLADVPTDPPDHDSTLYMEDTGFPNSSLDAYIDFWGRDYFQLLSGQPAASRLLDIEACFQIAHGTHTRRQAILLQRICSHERLLGLLSTDTPPERKAPGTYMAQALEYRDQWQSRLLCTARWSPRY